MGIEGAYSRASRELDPIELPRAVWELKAPEMLTEISQQRLNSHAQYGN